jgi:2,4-dienoyl-CoA reductase-like NADH-dependent reductase (Old Yellow Enzyme family)
MVKYCINKEISMSNLFDPLTIQGITLLNRIGVSTDVYV